MAPKKKNDDKVISPNKFSILDPDAEDVDVDCPCRVCKEDVTIYTDGMQCDRCSGWVHEDQKCSELTKPQFKFMKKNSNPAILYICSKCREDDLPQTIVSRDMVARNAIANNAVKLDSLGDSLALLKEQNKTIMEYMKTNSKTDNSIKVHVAEAIGDQKEQEKREKNVILYNVPESDPKATAPVVEAEVIQNVKNVFTFVEPSLDISNLSGKTVVRLGKPRTPTEVCPDPKPRPIKVILRSPQEVELLRKNARKLKDNNGLNHVGIAADKTWKERVKERELRQEFKTRKYDNKEDVVIYNNEVKLRSEIPTATRTLKVKEPTTSKPGQ